MTPFNDQGNSEPEKKKFKIMDLPEPTRRLIWKISIIVVMIPIIIVWIIVARQNFITESSNHYGSDDWQAITKKVTELSGEITGQPVNQNVNLDLSTSTDKELDQETVDRLTADWQVYRNSLGAFEIKFPDTLRYVENTATNTDLIVSFFSPDSATATLEFYRYQNVEDFINKPNLKKYWPAGYTYIVAYGDSTATATKPMLYTFELGPQNY